MKPLRTSNRSCSRSIHRYSCCATIIPTQRQGAAATVSVVFYTCLTSEFFLHISRRFAGEIDAELSFPPAVDGATTFHHTSRLPPPHSTAQHPVRPTSACSELDARWDDWRRWWSLVQVTPCHRPIEPFHPSSCSWRAWEGAGVALLLDDGSSSAWQPAAPSTSSSFLT